MVRLFTCIWIPEEIVKRIENLQKELLETNIKAKFIKKKNLHVTITFLGEVNENMINEIKMKLDECLKDVNEFHVKICDLKIIPNENYIRVIGVSVNDINEKLKELIRRVGKCIGGKFHEGSKLTLCRVKGAPNKDLLKDFIERNRNVVLGEFHVKNVSLVKSVLTKSGPRYETIHKTKLKENE
ncbi:MAG: RNA 2',3'-cyclic phosphodiesterase [Candidatus Aenigmarchaeota archaeon]|nr:RNA 2',3'-cyclic phosphodiesterase [Candidatus Aenigmarchaeota archaeon]